MRKIIIHLQRYWHAVTYMFGLCYLCESVMAYYIPGVVVLPTLCNLVIALNLAFIATPMLRAVFGKQGGTK